MARRRSAGRRAGLREQRQGRRTGGHRAAHRTRSRSGPRRSQGPAGSLAGRAVQQRRCRGCRPGPLALAGIASRSVGAHADRRPSPQRPTRNSGVEPRQSVLLQGPSDREPLAPFGAWNEAEVDHNRGRHLVAVKECRQYREKWPDGPHADGASSHGRCIHRCGVPQFRDRTYEATSNATRTLHERRSDWDRIGVGPLGSGPWHPVAARNRARPQLIPPTSPFRPKPASCALPDTAPPSRCPTTPGPTYVMRVAPSKRSLRGGMGDVQAPEDAADDPQVARWVEENEENYAWGTRRYDIYAEAMEPATPIPDPGVAWQIFRAWSREGEWAPLGLGEKGLEEHASDWRWKVPGTTWHGPHSSPPRMKMPPSGSGRLRSVAATSAERHGSTRPSPTISRATALRPSPTSTSC